MRMQGLKDDDLESVHVLHQSLVLLIVKGGIAWVIAAVLMLLLETSWVAIQNAFTPSAPVFSIASSQNLLSTGSMWEVILHLVLLIFYGWLVLLVVLRWIYSYYIIEPKNIIIRKGVIFSTEDRFNMEGMQSTEVRQGLLGKIFNYGTVRLFNPEQKEEVLLRDISDPYREAAFIDKFYPSANVVHVLPKIGNI